MTSDLDVKGPAVQSSKHNTERDIPRAHAAPQPGNDPSGLVERLLRLSQQFEDQHAPQNITMTLREAANRLSNHRT